MGDSGTSEELDGAGACQSPKVGLAEVGVAHVDGMEEIAYDGQALEKRIGTRKRFDLIGACYGVGRVGAFRLETSGRSLGRVRRAEAQERSSEAARCVSCAACSCKTKCQVMTNKSGDDKIVEEMCLWRRGSNGSKTMFVRRENDERTCRCCRR